MSVEELDSFFKTLGVMLTPLECEEALRQMDTDESDGESLVSLEMIIGWLQNLGLFGDDIDFHELRTPNHTVSYDGEANGGEADGGTGPYPADEGPVAEWVSAEGGGPTSDGAGDSAAAVQDPQNPSTETLVSSAGSEGD